MKVDFTIHMKNLNKNGYLYCVVIDMPQWEEENKVDLNSSGWKGLKDCWEKRD
jgi:hypothetical protein